MAKEDESEGSNAFIVNSGSVQKITASNITLGLPEDRSLLQKLDGDLAKRILESMNNGQGS
jgi:hypothetical protein